LNNEDPLVERMVNEITMFACKRILNEWEVPFDDVVELDGTTPNHCHCPAFQTYFLPCRHIMKCRVMLGEYN